MSFLANIWNSLRNFYEARHEPENMRPLAEWYWRTLLTFAFSAIFLIIGYGAWGFFGVLNKLSEGDSLKRSDPPEVLSRAELAKILSAYSERQAAFDAAKQSRTTVADPSR